MRYLVGKVKICIDFDGTIVEENVPWPQDPKLLEGAKEKIQLLKDKGYWIIIYSARNNPAMPLQKEKFQQMIDLLKQYEIPYDQIWMEPKPIATFFIDDRSIRFDNWNNVERKLSEILT